MEKLTSYSSAVLDRHKFHLARLNVAIIRNEINDGLDCVHDPVPNNYAHALIVSRTGKIADSKSRALAKSATLIDQNLI